jgi:hypothetical protein
MPNRWQARRESNPQPAVLETAALPIELLACVHWLKWPTAISADITLSATGKKRGFCPLSSAAALRADKKKKNLTS